MDPFEPSSYRQIRVGSGMVGMNGLDEIFSALYAEGRELDEGVIPELLERARRHNYIPSFSKDAYTHLPTPGDTGGFHKEMTPQARILSNWLRQHIRARGGVLNISTRVVILG